MTDQSSTEHTEAATEAPEDQQNAPEPPAATEAATEPQEPEQGSNSEAAKWRRKLRAAEAERDSIREQLTELRRQVAEDASGLTKPAGLWAAEVDVNALYGKEGRLDLDKLGAAVTDASERLGLTRAPRAPRPDPNQGRASAGPRGGFAEAFRP